MSQKSLEDELDESVIVAAVAAQLNDTFQLSWSDLKNHTEKDPVLSRLISSISEGFPDMDREVLKEFWRYREAFYLEDGVVMYDDRVVVPFQLRSRVLDFLHSAHQCE